LVVASGIPPAEHNKAVLRKVEMQKCLAVVGSFSIAERKMVCKLSSLFTVNQADSSNLAHAKILLDIALSFTESRNG